MQNLIKLFVFISILGCNNPDPRFKKCHEQPNYDIKNYMLLSADDNLNDEDIQIFDVGLTNLNYGATLVDYMATSVTFEDVVCETPTFLYFSGHGRDIPLLYFSDKYLYPTPYLFNASFVFISACSVLDNSELIKQLMGPNTLALMGYAQPIHDIIDNTMAKEMLNLMNNGNTLPEAFYITHRSSRYHDRYVMYIREGNNIIEYSERTNLNYINLDVYKFEENTSEVDYPTK